MPKRSVIDWRPLDERPALGWRFDDAELRRWAARRRDRDEDRAQRVLERALRRAWRPWLDQIIEVTGLPVQDGDVPYGPPVSVERRMPRRQALLVALRDAVRVFFAQRAEYGCPTPKMQADAFKGIEATAQRLIKALGCQPGTSPPALPPRLAGMPAPWGRSLLGALANADPDIWTGEAVRAVPIAVQSGLVDAATKDAEAWGNDFAKHEADRSVREAIAAVKALHRWAAEARCEALTQRDDGTDRDDPALDILVDDLGDAYRSTFGKEPGFSVATLGGEVDGPFARFVAASMRLLLPEEPPLTHSAIRARWRRVNDMAT